MIQNFQSQKEWWGFKPSLSSHTCFNNFFYRLVFCGQLFLWFFRCFEIFLDITHFVFNRLSRHVDLFQILTGNFRYLIIYVTLRCFFTFSCNFLIFESIELSLFTKSGLLVVIFVSNISSCFRVLSSVSKSETQSHKTMASFSCFYVALPPFSSSSLSSVNLESSS